MPATVSDASVIGALVFEEPNGARAEQILGDSQLHVPALFAYELANIARTKERRGETSREDLLGALRRGFALDLRWHDVPPLPVFALASDTGLTAYDASYLYLAMVLSLPIVTFDSAIRAAAVGRVQLL